MRLHPKTVRLPPAAAYNRKRSRLRLTVRLTPGWKARQQLPVLLPSRKVAVRLGSTCDMSPSGGLRHLLRVIAVTQFVSLCSTPRSSQHGHSVPPEPI